MTRQAVARQMKRILSDLRVLIYETDDDEQARRLRVIEHRLQMILAGLPE